MGARHRVRIGLSIPEVPIKFKNSGSQSNKKERSNKILFEHDPSFFLAYSDCLTSFRDIRLQNIDKGRQVAGLLSTSSRQLKYSHKTIK